MKTMIFNCISQHRLTKEVESICKIENLDNEKEDSKVSNIAKQVENQHVRYVMYIVK